MFRRRKACASEYKANSFAFVNERSQGSIKAMQRLFRVAAVKNIQASLIFFARLLLICAPREYIL
ncbi:MAG: hypothetical protein IJA04_07290, partial [Bacteroidaceae bacterium]|nr:hypothetical protein [Bacteroidaceae bacterium]